MILNAKIDTKNFMQGFQVLRVYSKTEPSKALHRAVAFVVHDAKQNTPFVTTGKIDAELNVQATPMLVTRGARAGLPRKDNKQQLEIADGGLAMRIQLARLNPNSNYNALTDNRYKLDRASFSPGMGYSGFVQRLKLFAQRMVARRHSSTHFFEVSWNALLAHLADLVPDNYRAAVTRWHGGRGVSMALGRVIPARAGESLATCKIENRIGMDEHYPTINAIRNMEAHRILEPVLQASINREYENMVREGMKRGLLDNQGKLTAKGFRITG